MQKHTLTRGVVVMVAVVTCRSYWSHRQPWPNGRGCHRRGRRHAGGWGGPYPLEAVRGPGRMGHPGRCGMAHPTLFGSR